MPFTRPAIRGVAARTQPLAADGNDWRSASGTAGAEIELPSLKLNASSGFMAGGVFEFTCSGRWGEATTANDTTWRVYFEDEAGTATQLAGFVCTDTWPDSSSTVYPQDAQFTMTMRLRPHDHGVPDEQDAAQNRLSCSFDWFLTDVAGGTSIVTTTLGRHVVDGSATLTNGANFVEWRAHKLFNDLSGGDGTDLFASAGRIYVTFEKEATSTLIEVYNACWIPFTPDRA